MTYLQVGQAAENSAYRQRVKAALFEIAQMVISEPVETPGHYERLLMARAVTGAPDNHVSQLSWLSAAHPLVWSTVAMDPVTKLITVAVEDAVIRQICAAAWNAVAGVQS